jgi:exopolysaccharide biosynthesis operon protein EpsL
MATQGARSNKEGIQAMTATLKRFSQIVAFVLSTTALAAEAKEGDVWNFSIGDVVTYDSNILRLPSGTSPQNFGLPQDSRGAFYNQLYGKMLFNLPVRQQRFLADFTLSDNRYDDFGYLNWRGLNGTAQWLWVLGRRWKGDLTYVREMGLSDPADFRAFGARNVHTTDAGTLNADFWLQTNWHIAGGVNATRFRNSAAILDANEVNQYHGELGLKYEARDNNFVRLMGRYTYGEYPNRAAPTLVADTEYEQYDVGIDGSWQVTGASRLYGRVDYTQRKYPNLSFRDFSGPTGRVGYDWAITVKTGLNFLLLREIGALEDITALYVLTTAGSVKPYWEITSKVRLEGNLERVRREYEGAFGTTATPVPEREDRFTAYGLTITWNPTFNWLFGAGYQHLTRGSNAPLLDFSTDIGFVRAQFNF